MLQVENQAAREIMKMKSGRTMKNLDSDRSEDSPLEMIEIGEAARLLGVPVKTVWLWSDIGVLQACSDGATDRKAFRLDDIRTFLESGNGRE